jgi:RluA family pseudouridine synthase
LSPSNSRTLVVERPLAGVRLFDFLQRNLDGARPVRVRQLVGAGCVTVNGVECLSDRRLRVDDVVIVEHEASDGSTPHVATDTRAHGAARLTVLHETAHVLVVDKPAGVPTVPDRSGRQQGIHGELGGLRPGDDLRIVHRLDRDTSGCLVIGKGVEAARHFDAEFRDHRVQKVYVALVDGVVAADQPVITAWLGPDRSRPGRVVASATERSGFRDALTEVLVRERFRAHTLVELRPRTGRGHQLRVHLRSIGHPIAADRDYGGEALLLSRLKPGYKKRVGVDEHPLLERMFLHAERITFCDVDGQQVTVEAPLPEDLNRALRQLERHAPRR